MQDFIRMKQRAVMAVRPWGRHVVPRRIGAAVPMVPTRATFVANGAAAILNNGQLQTVMPAGVLAGDLLLMFASTSLTAAQPAVAGWSDLSNVVQAEVGEEVAIRSWWSRAATANPAAPIIDTTGGMTIASILAYRYAQASGTPFEGVVGDIGPNGFSYEWPAMTGPTDDLRKAVLVCANGFDLNDLCIDAGSLVSADGPVSERVNQQAQTGSGSGIAIGDNDVATNGLRGAAQVLVPRHIAAWATLGLSILPGLAPAPVP